LVKYVFILVQSGRKFNNKTKRKLFAKLVVARQVITSIHGPGMFIRLFKGPTAEPILSLSYTVHALKVCMIIFNTCLRLVSACLTHFIVFNLNWLIQIMKLLIMKFRPVLYSPFLGLKYSCMHLLFGYICSVVFR
jgi:hypothetical protein